MGAAEPLGGEAGDDVELVARPAGDEAVGAVDAGLLQSRRIGGVPAQQLYVEPVEALGLLGIVLDDHHVVLTLQHVGELIGDLTVARDHDPHVGPLS